MTSKPVESPDAYFRRRGLEPQDWEQTLRAAETQLELSAIPAFRAAHRTFIAYPNERTCRAFYDFAADHGLLATLASFRFHRLRRIAEALTPLPLRGSELVEVGAGAGYLAGFVRDILGAKVRVEDWSEKTRSHLSAAGFDLHSGTGDIAHKQGYADFLLCADALGEVHSDEDGWLRDPENFAHPEYPEEYAEELESRYGFVEKLSPWKPLLSRAGCVLLFEPIPIPEFWKGLAESFSRAGWKAAACGPDPLWYLVATPG